MMHLNYIAVLVTAVVGFMLGGLWYSALFGKMWRTEMKITEEQRKQFMGVVQDMQKKIEPLIEDAQSGGNPAEIIEATAQGQVVIAIDVEPIVKNLRSDVTELSAAREIDVRARGRSYRVVLTPDLEAGGYSVEVPELPGCITEGDTLPEARRMAREAIEAWLDVAAPQGVRGRAHAR